MDSVEVRLGILQLDSSEEKAIERHTEKKHKVKIYSLLVKRLNIDTLTHAKVTSR